MRVPLLLGAAALVGGVWWWTRAPPAPAEAAEEKPAEAAEEEAAAPREPAPAPSSLNVSSALTVSAPAEAAADSADSADPDPKSPATTWTENTLRDALLDRLEHGLALMTLAQSAPSEQQRDAIMRQVAQAQADHHRLSGQVQALPEASQKRIWAAVAELAQREAAAAEEMQRQALAHHLMANPDFQLKKEKGTPVQEHMASIMRRAFWDGVREDVAAGNFDRVVALVAELKGKILELVKGRESWRVELDENLDEALLLQMLQNGAFDNETLSRVVTFATSKLRDLQSEQRDAAVDAWLQGMLRRLAAADAAQTLALLPEIFEFLFESLDTVKLDIANYHLRAIAPVLQREGVEYARQAFAKQVAEGRINLDRTKAFVERAVAEQPGGVVTPPEVEGMLRRALLELILVGPSEEGLIPETLQLDARDLGVLYESTRSVVRVSVQLMRTRMALSRAGVHLRDEEALTQLKVGLIEAFTGAVREVLVPSADGKTVEVRTPHPSQVVAARAVEVIGSLTVEPLPQEVAQLLAEEIHADREDAVFNLVTTRVHTAVRALVEVPGGAEGAEEVAAVREKLKASGILLWDEIKEVAQRARALLQRNIRTHAERYNAFASA